LATRERELVQLKPEDIKKAQQWIGVNSNASGQPSVPATTPSVNAPPMPGKKMVSFSNTTTTNIVEEEHEIEQFEPEHKSKDENFEETDFILSKFKKVSEPPPSASESSVLITTQQLYNKIIELERTMNANHAEIISYLTRIKEG